MKIVVLFLTALSFILADDYIIGGANGFGDIHASNNIRFSVNTQGTLSAKLAPQHAILSMDADMLLQFNNTFDDAARRYSAVASGPCRFEPGIADASLRFLTKKASVAITVPEGVFLSERRRIGDFTIEFRLNPARIEPYAEVFSRVGAFLENGEVKKQGLRAVLKNGRLAWEFIGLFRDGNIAKDIALEKGTFLPTGEWHHHSISYDVSRGRIVKYIDGLEDEIAYASRDGTEMSAMLTGYFSPRAEHNAVIGGFTGAIDEVMIRTSANRHYALHRVTKNIGELISRVKDLGVEDSFIRGISVRHSAPGGADVRLYYRVSSRYFLPENTSIPWSYVPNESRFADVRGRYLQLKVALASDTEGKHSPSVDAIVVSCEPDEVPLVPTGLVATAGNTRVTLRWDAVPDRDIAGYKIYYGNESGYYDGERSPIIARGRMTNFTVSDLVNDELYYFRISAFHTVGPMHESETSAEVYARPKPFLAAR
ncbi:MAG: fibronectin type III domain-containing protein [Spirochaetota bacterium]